MANLRSKDRPANPTSFELWFNLLATAVQVKVDVNEGQGDFPEVNPAGQDNPNNDDAPLLKGFPLVFCLGLLVFWIVGPLQVGAAVAWTDVDPLAIAVQVALSQIMVFGCMVAWAAVLRAIVKLRKRLEPNDITLSPRSRISRQDRSWAILAFFIIWAVTYLCCWIPVLMWKEGVAVQSILKMRKTYLALESNFDVKDVLLNITACLNVRLHDRKAEIADVVICLQTLGVPKGPLV